MKLTIETTWSRCFSTSKSSLACVLRLALPRKIGKKFSISSSQLVYINTYSNTYRCVFVYKIMNISTKTVVQSSLTNSEKWNPRFLVSSSVILIIFYFYNCRSPYTSTPKTVFFSEQDKNLRSFWNPKLQFLPHWVLQKWLSQQLPPPDIGAT